MRGARRVRRGGRRQPDAGDRHRQGARGADVPDHAGVQAQGRPDGRREGLRSAGCASCHTLAAAHATGTVGPNLDQLKPNYRAVTAQVTNGGAAMPSFKKTLSTQQIADVAAYVVKSTGGTVP